MRAEGLQLILYFSNKQGLYCHSVLVEGLVVGQRVQMGSWTEKLSLVVLVSLTLPSTSASQSISTSTCMHFSIFETEICDNRFGHTALWTSSQFARAPRSAS